MWAVLAVLGLCLGAAGVAGSAPQHSAAAFTFRQVTSGLDSPVFVTSAPGDATTLYVVEQRGVIAIVRGGKIAGTFLDLRPAREKRRGARSALDGVRPALHR